MSDSVNPTDEAPDLGRNASRSSSGISKWGGASLRPLLRPICWLRGHRDAAWMLPEEEFGLYAYSRLFCSRCEQTFAQRPGRLPDGSFPLGQYERELAKPNHIPGEYQP